MLFQPEKLLAVRLLVLLLLLSALPLAEHLPWSHLPPAMYRVKTQSLLPAFDSKHDAHLVHREDHKDN